MVVFKKDGSDPKSGDMDPIRRRKEGLDRGSYRTVEDGKYTSVSGGFSPSLD